MTDTKLISLALQRKIIIAQTTKEIIDRISINRMLTLTSNKVVDLNNKVFQTKIVKVMQIKMEVNKDEEARTMLR